MTIRLRDGEPVPYDRLGSAGAPVSLAKAVGSAAMYLGSAGNAYGEALEKGYSEPGARVYSTLVGLSEVTLQKMLGGISEFGGLPAKLEGKISAIKSGLWKGAAKFAASEIGEISEEVLQNYLEPLFRTLVFGEEYDAPTVEENVETAVTTFLSTGVMEVPGITSETIKEYRYNNALGTETKPGNIDWDQAAITTEINPVSTTEEKTGNTKESITQQLRSNQAKLDKMDPVADIQTPANFESMSVSEKMMWVVEKLRSTNYKVDRKGFGTIMLTAKQLKSAFNYFTKGGIEEASFEAVPYVLEYGEEIASREDHKGRGYGTVTIAAPVTINGKRGNMAVVVKRTTDNYYKVHRVLTPDGKVFSLTDTKEAEPTPAGESPNNGSLATPISSASTNSISENGQIVNAADGAANRGRKVGWDGRVAVTEAKGPNITVDGVTYKLLGLDENGSKVYQDAEVLKQQAAESPKGERESAQSTEDGVLKTPGELGEKAVPYSERGIEIEPRLTGYLSELQNDADYIVRDSGEIRAQDLAVLTTETGAEFTLVTVNGKEYLIRGDEKSTTIPSKLVDVILNEKGAITCHSHPFVGDLMPSESDLEFLKRLTWQTESVIVDPTQQAVRFTMKGPVEVYNLSNTNDGDFYNSFFGGGE